MINPLIKHLMKAPDSQLDKSMKNKLANVEGLSDIEAVETVFDILNMSVNCGLASDLMILSMESILKVSCDSYKYDYKIMLKESIERCEKEEENFENRRL